MGARAQPKVAFPGLEPAELPPVLHGRLGLDVPREHWPTVPRLKALEAAGFAWLQVHCPPKAVLADPASATYYALALRAVLDPTDLRLVVHAPDDLVPGDRADRQVLAGVAGLVNCAGAEVVVVHGAVGPPERRAREAAALRELAAAVAPATVAVENTAATYPGPALPRHDPAEIVALVEAVGSPNVAMCLDVGHAHLRATATGADLSELIGPALERAALVHLHDNLGADRPRERSPRLVPLRLDLHLPPGAGALPWESVAGALVATSAPLLLELHPPHRPEPQSLATVTAELLTRRR
ncbi:MAG: Xylose isomerase domain protein barrel [Solirubrobacterales bacterium]|nr:Xylose isomerase domain protein barrel [Solirubrobacterales bacterium]